MRKSIAAAAALLFLHQSASAATVPADGYIYSSTLLPEATEGCVANAPGGVFVGVGPQPVSFPPPAKTRSILFVSESGTTRTVATGFNSLSDCVYDAANDVLYVLDSGQEFPGSTTGDTVFAIPGDATSATADGHELLPAGSIPYAFSVDLVSGGLLVADAAGSGNGTVLEIDLSGMTPSTSTFANGFDYTGGIIVDGSRVLVSEALQPNFDSAIYDYSLAGAYQSTVSGPTYNHGSNDLEIAPDGNILVTGSNTIVSVDDSAVATPLVTGLDGGQGFPAFGGSVSVNDASGRIDFLASSFSGADDDKSIHHLVPIDHLSTGGGSEETDCAMEFYGAELVPAAPGRPARSAICVDGAACDADRQVNGSCTFPLGLCFNVDDARLPDCSAAGISAVELRRAKPENAGAETLVAAAALALPSSSTCVFGDGFVLPLRESSGGLRKSKGRVQVRATTSSVTDTDTVRFVCEPAE